MKKKKKHKKQLRATHPISESERIENLMRVVSNPGEPTKLKYDKTQRKLIPSSVENTSVVSLVKKDSLLW